MCFVMLEGGEKLCSRRSKKTFGFKKIYISQFFKNNLVATLDDDVIGITSDV